jgi:hypothetical protein
LSDAPQPGGDPPPEPPPGLPRHDVSGRHYVRSCLIVLLVLVLLAAAFIALTSYLAFHNPRPH